MKKLFGVDIIADPDLAMRDDVAAFIMFEGVINGKFPGKMLKDISHQPKSIGLAHG